MKQNCLALVMAGEVSKNDPEIVLVAAKENPKYTMTMLVGRHLASDVRTIIGVSSPIEALEYLIAQKREAHDLAQRAREAHQKALTEDLKSQIRAAATGVASPPSPIESAQVVSYVRRRSL